MMGTGAGASIKLNNLLKTLFDTKTDFTFEENPLDSAQSATGIATLATPAQGAPAGAGNPVMTTATPAEAVAVAGDADVPTQGFTDPENLDGGRKSTRRKRKGSRKKGSSKKPASHKKRKSGASKKKRSHPKKK